MSADDLRAKWVEYDRKLDACLRLNRDLLRETKLAKARTAMQVHVAFLTAECLITLLLIAALGMFLARHVSQVRLMAPAVALDLFAIATLIVGIRQLVGALQLDYGRPIIAIQKQLEALRIRRIRLNQWILVLAPLLWTPGLIVVLSAVTRSDPFSYLNPAWLLANVAFGCSILALALWLSRRYADRMNRSPLIQGLLRDLAGRELAAASAFVAKLSEFESEGSGVSV